MNLDDLMDVWRSQDASPLHEVNKTLLHLALRQEQAKLHRERRIERWTIYTVSAGVVAGMALFLGLMIYARDRRVVTGWDFVVPIVGAAAALLAGGAMYMNHRAQARREQIFGASLRDQLSRSIAELNYRMTTLYRTIVLVTVLLAGIGPIAILILGWRINQKAISDDGYMLVSLIVLSIYGTASGVWVLRRQVQQEVLPRKRRLEALLKELDAP
jgi:hypothetical protein